MTRRRPSNAALARALREMALFLEMDAVPFKPQAYERAAHTVEACERPLAELYARGGEKALAALPGIGKGIAARLGGMITTGTMADLEALREQTPVDILGLTAIEGIGPRRARELWQALGVRSIADLKRAAQQGRIRALPHRGERGEQKLLEAIEHHEAAAGRRPLGEVLAIARRIEAALSQLPGVAQAAVVGSIRRRRESVGDVDVLVAATGAEPVLRGFTALPEVQRVLTRGPARARVHLTVGLDAELRVLPPEQLGAALLYFTGSRAHHAALRAVARRRGLRLARDGLFRGEQRLAASSEAEVYAALGMQWIAPELREDTGEVERAQRGELPILVAAADIRGDLQVHSNWTDGSASIYAMARAARALGREYLVITDRSHDLAIGELAEDRLRAQVQEIRAVDRKLDGIRVLAGAEVDIRPDGSLDVDDELLAELDLVGVALHSDLEQPRAEMTRRVVRAIEHPRVDLLLHPLARILGSRRAVDLDFEAVLTACQRSGTALEIDSRPLHLDLPDALVRHAVAADLRLAVDSGAHTIDELGLIETLGLGVARRGWVRPANVLNTLPVDELLATLKHHAAEADEPRPRTATRPGARPGPERPPAPPR